MISETTKSKPEIEFVYLVNIEYDGKTRVSMTFFPIKTLHDQADIDNVKHNAERDSYYNEYTLEIDLIWL